MRLRKGLIPIPAVRARAIWLDAPLIGVISLVFCGVLFEAYLQLRDDGLILSEMFVPDYELSYRLRPHLEGELRGTRIAINSLGLRDREVEAKAEGEIRVLCMGDSMTFGLGVEPEHTWPAQLESRLREALPDTPVRVVNAGIPSYDTRNEVIFLEELAPRTAPDLVVVGFWSNDTGVSAHWENRDRFGFLFLKWLSYNSRAVSQIRGWLRLRESPPPPPGSRAGQDVADGEGGLPFYATRFQTERNPDFQRIIDAFERLARWQREMGTPVVIAYLPSYRHAADPDHVHLLYETIGELAARNALDFLDLRAAFRDFDGDPESLSLLAEHNDDHTSALGNALIAAAVERKLAPMLGALRRAP